MALDKDKRVLKITAGLFSGFGWVFHEYDITDEVSEVKLKPEFKRTFKYENKGYIMERWWLIPQCVDYGHSTVSLEYGLFCYDTEKDTAKQILIDAIKSEHNKIKAFIIDTEPRFHSDDESLINPNNYCIE